VPACRRSLILTLWRNSNAPSDELYSHAIAPNPRQVRIFAAENGIELALEDIDIWSGKVARRNSS
jgi:hypothetical protein